MHAFAALGDETRRGILEALSERERSVTELVPMFGISQPAVSQHLRVLRDAGLVDVRAEAQRRYYRVRPEGFRVIELWLERYRRTIARTLDDLERHMDEHTEAPQ
jgi:DNA-binding transcriptional ArsR family regulator